MLILTYCQGQGNRQVELECRGAGLAKRECLVSVRTRSTSISFVCKYLSKWFQKVVNPGKYEWHKEDGYQSLFDALEQYSYTNFKLNGQAPAWKRSESNVYR